MGHGRGIATHAEGSGGRQVYDDMDKYGNIYDHFAIAYQWENGTRGYHFSRQQNGTAAVTKSNSTDRRASARLKNRHAILAGDDAWRYRGEDNDMYQTEHDTLFKAVRGGGKPLTTGSEPRTAQWSPYLAGWLPIPVRRSPMQTLLRQRRT